MVGTTVQIGSIYPAFSLLGLRCTSPSTCTDAFGAASHVVGQSHSWCAEIASCYAIRSVSTSDWRLFYDVGVDLPGVSSVREPDVFQCRRTPQRVAVPDLAP